MRFSDHRFDIATKAGVIRAVITGSALHALWGEGMGMDEPALIVDRYRSMLETNVADMLEAGASVDEDVRVTEVELDM